MATLAQLVSSLLSVLNCERSASSSGQLVFYTQLWISNGLFSLQITFRVYFLFVTGTCCMCILWGWILQTVWLQPETLRLKSSSWVVRILAVPCLWVQNHIHIYLYMSKMYSHYIYSLIFTTTSSTTIIIIINIVL